jgi:hypothetical protein
LRICVRQRRELLALAAVDSRMVESEHTVSSRGAFRSSHLCVRSCESQRAFSRTDPRLGAPANARCPRQLSSFHPADGVGPLSITAAAPAVSRGRPLHRRGPEPCAHRMALRVGEPKPGHEKPGALGSGDDVGLDVGEK